MGDLKTVSGAVLAIVLAGGAILALPSPDGPRVGLTPPPPVATSSIGFPNGAFVIADHPPLTIGGEVFQRPFYAFVSVPVSASASPRRKVVTLRGGASDLNIDRSFSERELPVRSGNLVVPVQLSSGDDTRVAIWIVDEEQVLAPTRIADMGSVTEFRK